jgi:carboxymethylenebutenolidase
MVPSKQSRTECYGFIPLLCFLLAAGISGCGHIQAASPRMAPASAPPGIDAPGAQWYKLDGSNGRKFLTAVLRPQGAGPFPVVVVLHGAGGLGKGYLSIADDLARAGFLVVVGCWHAGERPTPGTAICSEATPQAEWVADPAANSGKELIAMAKTLPNAQADRVGLYGISRGGHAALWAASTGAGVQAVVADAPAHRPAITPAPASSQDVVARLDAPLLILHGTADQAIPVEQSREYERAARALGKSIAVVYFEGIGHMPSLLPESQIEARQRAIAFLREKL